VALPAASLSPQTGVVGKGPVDAAPAETSPRPRGGKREKGRPHPTRGKTGEDARAKRAPAKFAVQRTLGATRGVPPARPPEPSKEETVCRGGASTPKSSRMAGERGERQYTPPPATPSRQREQSTSVAPPREGAACWGAAAATAPGETGEKATCRGQTAPHNSALAADEGGERRTSALVKPLPIRCPLRPVSGEI